MKDKLIIIGVFSIWCMVASIIWCIYEFTISVVLTEEISYLCAYFLVASFLICIFSLSLIYIIEFNENRKFKNKWKKK